MAECTPLFLPGTELTGYATAPVVGKTFADISADIQSGPLLSPTSEGGNISVATCAAAARALGVFKTDGAQGDKVGIHLGGVVPVTAGAAITAGQEVQAGAAGTAVPLAAGRPAGKAVTAAANNTDVFVRLY